VEDRRRRVRLKTSAFQAIEKPDKFNRRDPAVTQRTKRGLKFAAAAILAALLVAITVNVAVDFWTPQAELKNPAPAIEPASLRMPPATQPLPAPPLPQQPAAVPAQPQWNQPLFEPKFDGPGAARGGSAQGFTAPDFSNVLNQYAPLGQVLPPSVSMPGSSPAPVSIRPIFNSKAGGVEGGALDAAGSLPGSAGSTVGGAVSGAGALLNRR
jgi:hypothetical protein